MSNIDVINISGLAPAGGVQPANHAAWLEQLESAQWQQRLRYGPQDGRQQSRGNSASEQDDTLAKASIAAAPVNSQGSASGHPTGEPKAVGHKVGNAANNVVGARATMAQPAITYVPPPTQLPPAFGNDQEQATPQQLRRLLTATWQTQNAHVMLSAEGLRVWLRDARYHEGEGYKLLRELRGRFADLGLRLAQFTLNGVQVSNPNHFD